jgi:hypothetical protein
MASAKIWVDEKTLHRIVVRGDGDVDFDYFVNGIRRGFADYDAIQENRILGPMVRGEPHGTQFPEDFRKILVENGTLNPDFTPNEVTARKLGWELLNPEEDSQHRRTSREKDLERRRQDQDRFEKDSRKNHAKIEAHRKPRILEERTHHED